MYTAYTQYVADICDNKDLSDFKRNEVYRGMLEHVSPEIGTQYLSAIRGYTQLSLEDIGSFSALNDSVGKPLTANYSGLSISPSTLRYIFHSHLILSHLRKLALPQVDVVEVGGGYGGLCLALHHFAGKYGVKINSYTIIDLTDPSRLQQLYLSRVAPTLQVDFADASTFGADIDRKNMFLVSNYCFSELTHTLQKEYIAKLFPKVSHGFMAWNWIPLYHFGFSMKEEEEYPKTGPHNRYVYF
jgi:hypothetical protein